MSVYGDFIPIILIQYLSLENGGQGGNRDFHSRKIEINVEYEIL
jgi:hypothetical protein